MAGRPLGNLENVPAAAIARVPAPQFTKIIRGGREQPAKTLAFSIDAKTLVLYYRGTT